MNLDFEQGFTKNLHRNTFNKNDKKGLIFIYGVRRDIFILNII